MAPIDISDMPDLLDLVEEVEATKKPRELRRDNKPVALLTPISEYASADAGKENIVNKSLSITDSVSSQCLNALLLGKEPFNEKRQNNDLFEGLHIIRPKQ
jgi:hypothetical protein